MTQHENYRLEFHITFHHLKKLTEQKWSCRITWLQLWWISIKIYIIDVCYNM